MAASLEWPAGAAGLALSLLPPLLVFGAASLFPWRHKARAARVGATLWAVAMAGSALEPFDDRLPLRGGGLHSGRPHLHTQAPHRMAPRRVVLVSSVSNGYQLPAGTEIARITVSHPGKAPEVHPVRIGDHTGEWAAERPDVAPLHRGGDAAVWAYRPSQDRAFFARLYRAEWALDGSPASSLSIALTGAHPQILLRVERFEALE